MLFALHDARGTVLHPAFLAIDHGLRGAVLAELKLRGHLQTRASGEARLSPSPPKPPSTALLRDALSALGHTSGPVEVAAWLERLSRVMPDLRQRVLALLEGRGLLSREERERVGLEGARSFVARDGSAEQEVRGAVNAALDEGDAITPRDGLLVALTVACHLEDEVFGSRSADAARRAAWVAERDAIVRATLAAVATAEGVEP